MKIAFRKVGILQAYTGTDNTSQGWFDDFDGKWVYVTSDTIRTIGNAASGAAIAASWTATLFSHIWTQWTNTDAPLFDSSGNAASRGASAAADYAANRRLTLPDYRGRVIGGAGTGASLTARALHTRTGEENHVQTIAEMPSHSHNDRLISTLGSAVVGYAGMTAATLSNNQPSYSTGGGGGFNVVQPTVFEHYVISAGAR